MSKYRFKTKPYAHQVDALRKLLGEPAKNVGGGLPMDMGTGKTKVVIDYANIRALQGHIDRVLVIAPLSALGVWEREIIKHSPDDSKLRWKTINYDKLVRKDYHRKDGVRVQSDHFTPLTRWIHEVEGRVLLVLDESHEIKNPLSKQSKAVFVLSQLTKLTVWMTGTPTGGNPMDFFAQMRAVDEGILGSSWGVFKRTYGVWGGYGGFQLIKYMNLPQLRKRVDPYIYAVKKEDCLDLPRRTHEVIPVTLEESRKVYDSLAKASIAEFEDMEVVTPHVFARMTRLSQLTGGWFVNEEKSKRVGREKERVFSDHMAQLHNNGVSKVVVFVKFIDDLKTVAQASKAAGYRVLPFYGAIPRDQRERFIARFDEADEPYVFAAQIRAGSQSISLTAADTTCFFSHDYSLIKYQQACDRNYRIGQTRPVTYYHFVCEDTIDEAVWLALRSKRKVADLILKHPELIT